MQQQDLTGADRRWAARYAVNDQLRYSRGSNAIGIERGSYARVVSTNLQENLLTVETKTGDLVTYDPRRLTGVSIYREAEQPFAVGDQAAIYGTVQGDRCRQSRAGDNRETSRRKET